MWFTFDLQANTALTTIKQVTVHNKLRFKRCKQQQGQGETIITAGSFLAQRLVIELRWVAVHPDIVKFVVTTYDLQ